MVLISRIRIRFLILWTQGKEDIQFCKFYFYFELYRLQDEKMEFILVDSRNNPTNHAIREAKNKFY